MPRSSSPASAISSSTTERSRDSGTPSRLSWTSVIFPEKSLDFREDRAVYLNSHEFFGRALYSRERISILQSIALVPRPDELFLEKSRLRTKSVIIPGKVEILLDFLTLPWNRFVLPEFSRYSMASLAPSSETPDLPTRSRKARGDTSTSREARKTRRMPRDTPFLPTFSRYFQGYLSATLLVFLAPPQNRLSPSF